MFEIRVHGLGGQGAVTLCTWTAQAGHTAGRQVQAFPFFGAERRGAPVKAFVRLDDDPIDLRSQVYRPNLLVVMSQDLIGLALSEGITPEGRLLINGDKALAERSAERFGRDIFYVDATGIAFDLGLDFDGMPMVNLPMYGTVARMAGAGSLEEILEVVRPIAERTKNPDAYMTAVTRGWDSESFAEQNNSTTGEYSAEEVGLDISRTGVTPFEP